MRRRAWVAGLAILIFSFVFGCLYFYTTFVATPISIGLLSSRIDTEIPIGSTQEQVLGWISANGYLCRTFATTDNTESAGYIAIVYRRTLFVDNRISIFFHIGSDRLLEKVTIHEGPRNPQSAIAD